MTNRIIEIAPLAFMRGRTIDNAFIILDEAQNATNLQMKMFLTRIGPSAKCIITGDVIGVTTYTLTATDADGCKSSDNIIVNIIPYCIKVANAFTPNGDGINDLWTVYDNIECLKNVQVSIFNRYGAKVYENKNYQNNWNGTYKGKPVPDATYYAVLQFSLVNGRVFTVKTDLTIMR